MNFCSTKEATESHALVLFKMLGRMKNMPQIPSCENCKQTPCSNGQVVTFKNNFGGRARVEAIPGKGGDKKINILSSNSSDGTFIAEFKMDPFTVAVTTFLLSSICTNVSRWQLNIYF